MPSHLNYPYVAKVTFTILDGDNLVEHVRYYSTGKAAHAFTKALLQGANDEFPGLVPEKLKFDYVYYDPDKLPDLDTLSYLGITTLLRNGSCEPVAVKTNIEFDYTFVHGVDYTDGRFPKPA